MYQSSDFSDTSPLIDEALEKQLNPILEKLSEAVTLSAVIDSNKPESRELAVFLNHFSRLSDLIRCELYAPSENMELENHFICPFLPAVSLKKNGVLQNVSFHGIPGGKEINAFVLSIYNCSGAGQKLSPFLKKKIKALDKDIRLVVCVSLSCHHCASLVSACQYMALLNPRIHAAAIDARLYPDFVKSEKIERVPLLIINGDTRVLGGKTIEELYHLLKDL